MENRERFSLLTRYLHVIGGVAFVAALVLGLVVEEMERGPAMFQVMFFHKSFGLAVVGLVAFRLLELARSGMPAPLETHTALEVNAAKLVKVALYAVMILMPVSGLLMSWSGGYPAEFFGLFKLEPLIAKDEGLNELMGSIHHSAVPVILILLALHIGGAVKHKLIDKDGTLDRISPLAR